MGAEQDLPQALSGFGPGRVLLVFGAVWVPVSVPLRDAVTAAAAGTGVRVVGVDVDTHPVLADACAVVALPCCVLVVDGQDRGRRVGPVAADVVARWACGGRAAAAKTRRRRR